MIFTKTSNTSNKHKLSTNAIRRYLTKTIASTLVFVMTIVLTQLLTLIPSTEHFMPFSTLTVQAETITAELSAITSEVTQNGFSQQTLDKLNTVEKAVFDNASTLTLKDVYTCYYYLTNNLTMLDKRSSILEVLKRWSISLEKVYSQKKKVTEQFAMDLSVVYGDFFHSCIAYGPECDPLLLTNTGKLSALFKRVCLADKSFPKSMYQNALANQAYVQLLNKKYQALNDTVKIMEKTKDQVLGTTLNDTYISRAYKYMVEGNYSKGEKIVANYIKLFKSTIIKESGPYRTATNDILDDIYQLRKRNIGANFTDKLAKSLPNPVLKVSSVVPGGSAEKAGLKVGDLIYEYGTTKGLCYYQFSDLVRQNINQANIKLSVIRNGKAISFTVPGGRIGVSLEESFVK